MTTHLTTGPTSHAADHTPTAPAPAGVSKLTDPARAQDPAPEPVPEPDPEAVIDQARAGIDALDAEIVRLVRERMALSERVQRTRMANGGRRISLARENAVLRRWRHELGEPGTTLAMTLLELCRGRV
ncbi:chorismate mutase [Streptomyces sp. 3MP-14]|uniref:Chorismate mutase n=1 Tax=Streptomyces mimosae TaxID=2586635 RepID=A0A5N6AF17_9ACTN|nr:MULTISPECIES: chorismate mutase [Streptomyces]KAB8167251.1 chorismate mutase [Streptomyces mimosae]KAB8177191.1 chorismate mutase [Streptomyces sp. 3MP-14]